MCLCAHASQGQGWPANLPALPSATRATHQEREGYQQHLHCTGTTSGSLPPLLGGLLVLVLDAFEAFFIITFY